VDAGLLHDRRRRVDDFRTIKTMLYSRPDLLHHVLEVTAQAVTDYLNAQIEAGAQAVMMFDSWGGVLSDACLPRVLAGLPAAHRAGLKRERDGERVPVIVFTKGGGQWLETSPRSAAMRSAWTGPPTSAGAPRVGDKVALQGNLDPMALFAPPEQVAPSARRCSMPSAIGRGHVFNLGHGISQFTPPESVARWSTAVHEHSRAQAPARLSSAAGAGPGTAARRAPSVKHTKKCAEIASGLTYAHFSLFRTALRPGHFAVFRLFYKS
jgi:uroporphyrinogen decarboxylase